MRVLQSLVVITALAIWTAASSVLIDMASATHGCVVLSPIGPDGTIHQLTQAEMDAMTAGCSQPKLVDLVIPAIGYVVIVAVVVRVATGSRRPVVLGD